jgi:predicted dinucleotide-binding enzyme
VRIAIIGAGNVGSALARACREAGHSVVVSSRNPAHVEKIAGGLNVGSAATAADAVRAEMVVLAVPAKAVASVLDEIADLIVGAVLVNPSNSADGDREVILRATGSLSEAIVLLAPGARVVKAFNTVLASRLNDPVLDGVPLDGFYAGDDAGAKQVVAELLARMGFRPIDTGELLTAARALELMAFIDVSLNARNGWSWQSGWKLPGPTT